MIKYCKNGDFGLVILKYSGRKMDEAPLNLETILI